MAWRSKCGTWKLLDSELYRAVAKEGKTMWVHVSYSPTYIEQVLIRLLEEATSEQE